MKELLIIESIFILEVMNVYKKLDTDGEFRIYAQCDFCGEISIGDTVIVKNQRICIWCNSVVGYIWDEVNV